MTPAGTSNELDVQNEWEENTHTCICIYVCIQYRPTYKKHLLPPRMQAQFLNSPFLVTSQEYCTYFLFPLFFVSSALISSSFLRQSLLFSSPLCGRCMCVSACCCTAAVVHPHDPITKGRGGCRECQSPVHCGTPLPDVDTLRGTGRCRISQLYLYVCTVRTDRRPFLVPTSNPISCFLSPGAPY